VKENREGILAFQKLKEAFPEIAESLFVNGSGGVEKNIEIFIGRRFKKIGAHWSKKGAGRLMKLKVWKEDKETWEKFWQRENSVF
jgi:hypothetical protein